MIATFTVALVLIVQFGGAASPPTQGSTNQDPYSRFLYPLSRSQPTPEVTIDASNAPELRQWAEDARQLVRDWFPMITPLLATDHWRPPKRIKLTLKKGINAPAYTAGNEITASASWVQAHPDDFGMIIHELTHVIQAYPDDGDKPGWLVEGIADYIRWWRYEPESPRTPVNPQRARYTDSYRTTASFLAWIVGKYDRGIVRKLDEALRTRNYSPEIFKTATGKSVDDLWTEFIATTPLRQTPRPG